MTPEPGVLFHRIRRVLLDLRDEDPRAYWAFVRRLEAVMNEDAVDRLLELLREVSA